MVFFHRKLLSTLVLLGCTFIAAAANGQSTTFPLHLFSLSPVLPLGRQGIALPHPTGSGFLMEIGRNRIVWDSLDGEKSVVFDVNQVPRHSDELGEILDMQDYSPLPSGGCAVLIQWRKEGQRAGVEVAEFDADGEYTRSVPIHIPDFVPYRFAVFKSGYFFFEGGKPFSPYGGISGLGEVITDGMGTVEYQIHSSPIKSAPAARQAETGAKDSNAESKLYKTMSGNRPDSDPPSQVLEIAASKALLYSGDDGYIYAYWPDNPSIMERIAQEGSVEVIHLDEKKEGQVFSFVESSGRIAVARTVLKPIKGKPDASREEGMSVEVYNLSDPSSPAAYTPETTVAPILLGYERGSFYFVKWVENDARGKAFIAQLTP